MTKQVAIPGFTIQDDEGKVIAKDPGSPRVGRRVYGEDGAQVTGKRATHDYLLRAPKGLWKAFSRKCDQEGLSIRGALLFLVKDWTLGRIEIVDLPTRKRL